MHGILIGFPKCPGLPAHYYTKSSPAKPGQARQYFATAIKSSLSMHIHGPRTIRSSSRPAYLCVSAPLVVPTTPDRQSPTDRGFYSTAELRLGWSPVICLRKTANLDSICHTFPRSKHHSQVWTRISARYADWQSTLLLLCRYPAGVKITHSLDAGRAMELC